MPRRPPISRPRWDREIASKEGLTADGDEFRYCFAYLARQKTEAKAP